MSFVVDGDSIPYGYGLTSPATQNFAKLLSADAWFSSKGTYYNFATTGAVVYPGAVSPYVSISDRYTASVYPHRPTSRGGDGGSVAILLMPSGINDLALGRTATQLIADLTAYVSRAKGDGFTVWADTILPTQVTASTDPYRLAVNAAILAETTGADFVFDSAQCLPDPFDTTLYQVDGTHPTLLGHQRRAAYMAAAVNSGNPNIWGDTVAFTAHNGAGISAGHEVVGYNSARLNRGSAFDGVSGRFVAKRAGVLDVEFHGINNAGTGQGKVEIRKNGLPIGNAAFAMSDYGPIVSQAITSVEIGDVVSAWVTSGQMLPSPTQTTFSGRML